MNYITTDDVVAIHDEIVNETGGSLGIREPGMLVSVSEKPKTSFGNKELYPNIFLKAASIYEALINYHVFIDGNKRTAALSMYRFLTINGFELTATNRELEKYTLYIVTKNPDLAEVAVWIKKHTRKIK